MNFRQIHLDFHTSEKIEKIGSEFDKKQFQSMLKLGHINSITLFSKCHHGWAYHESEANEMHPGLSFDLLSAQLEACREIGVKTPIYISAGFDEKAAVKHPEWLARRIDERLYWEADFMHPGFHRLCMNSPYLDYLLEQIKEVCVKFKPDGIFLDIVDVLPCYCGNCLRELRSQGLDPHNEENIMALARKTHLNYLKRVRETIDSVIPGLPVFHNSGHVYRGDREREAYNSHYELESLPTGGWGYDHLPMSARYVWQLGKDYLSMTGRFHESWGEFGGFKHINALRYEASLAAALGAKFSIGDQMHPYGSLDKAVYSIIGDVYSELEQKEPWLDGVTPLADIGLLSCEAVNYKKAGYSYTDSNSSDYGALRILQEGNYLFDVIDKESDFSKYKLIILPDEIRIDGQLKDKLCEFTNNGGKLLASGESGLDENKDDFVFDFGVKYIGKNEFKPNYLYPLFNVKDLGVSAFVCYCEGEHVELNGGVELAKNENSFFNRTSEHFCSHHHSPASKTFSGVGIAEGKDGIYVSWKLFSEYYKIGSLFAKNVMHHLIEKILGSEKTITTNLPAQGIVTVMNQKAMNRYIIHLLYAPAVRRGEKSDVIEDLPTVCDTTVSFKTDKPIKNVYFAPQNHSADYELSDDGVLSVKVESFKCHRMIVVEY